MDENTIPLDDWVSTKDLVEMNPSVLTPSTLEWQLRNRHRNGLASAVVRIGRQLRVSKSRYSQWLASRAAQQGEPR